MKIMNNVSRAFHKAGFQLKKHSPEILVVAGVAGTVTSAVLACRATLKVNDILEQTKEDVDKIHAVREDETFAEQYTEEDSKKDLAIVYAQTGIKIAKLYAPAVAVGALSITAILTGHNILRKRNLALAAAYATVDKGFKDYRNRVIERFGKELDRELKYNIKAKEIEETVVNEDGTESTVKRVVEDVNIDQYSEYARIFDDGCLGWDKDAEHNLFYVLQQQNYLNDLLKTRKHVFLNEAYDCFGIPRTKAGNIVGWVYDEKCPIGDNYIDFGVWDIHNSKARDFVNGRERVLILDFNVDGPIWDLLN